MLTPRENLIVFLNHQIPERIPSYREDTQQYCPPETLERTSNVNGGKDWFGIDWAYEPTIKGFIPDTRKPPYLDDITEWRERIVFPDLDSIDWNAMVERDSAKFSKDKLNVMLITCGLFERLAATIGMGQANMALIEEPEACFDFFSALADFRVKELDMLITRFPMIDMFEIQDDWGTQNNSFMSPNTWKEIIGPNIKKITSFLKSKGRYLHMHSCGKIEGLLPNIIEAGIEHWTSSQSMNDLVGILKKYGKEKKLTITGGFDIPEWRAPDMTKEKLQPLVDARLEELCKGGAALPYVALRVPYVNECILDSLKRHSDFFAIKENCEF